MLSRPDAESGALDGSQKRCHRRSFPSWERGIVKATGFGAESSGYAGIVPHCGTVRQGPLPAALAEASVRPYDRPCDGLDVRC